MPRSSTDADPELEPEVAPIPRGAGTTIPLAVNLMPDGPVGQVADLARLTEDLGATRCLVYDEGPRTRDPFVTLTAMAAATDRVKIGTALTNPFVTHPGVTASAIASVDEFSGGRAFLTVGAGGGLNLGPLVIDRHRPLSAVEEMITVLRRLFAGETVDHEGMAFSLRAATLANGRPDLGIELAGRGPKMMALGARLGDGFNLSYIHKDLLGPAAATLRHGAGGRPFRISYSTMIVTTEAELEAARAQLTFRLVDSPAEVKERIGMTPDHVAAIRSALAAGGPPAAAAHVDPAWVSAFVIAGTEAECGRELHRILVEHDIDEYQLPLASVTGGAEQIERAAGLLSRR